jgi:hypothetical protein
MSEIARSQSNHRVACRLCLNVLFMFEQLMFLQVPHSPQMAHKENP